MTPSNLVEKPLSTSDNVENPYQVKNLDHLGLIAAQFDALGLGRPNPQNFIARKWPDYPPHMR